MKLTPLDIHQSSLSFPLDHQPMKIRKTGSSSSLISFVLFISCLHFHTSAKFSLAKSSKIEAEDLIRGLNLFPEHDVNIAAKKSLGNLPRIAERRFQFDSVGGDSGASVQDLAHHAGYFRLPNTSDARMFYFYFESRKTKTDPVIIWLTGGPGCGSELALFYENGPFQLTHNLSLVWNDFGWDKVSNIIFVDQPTGTGFSYSSDPNDIRHDEIGVSNDLYNFLQAFFHAHPEYVKNDFYITGESYAGHYVPALASRVHKGNKNKEGIHINLKGFAIGNGLTNPEIQFRAYPDYALEMKLLNQSDYNNMSQLVTQCEQATKLCGTGTGANASSTCTEAYDICINIFLTIVRMNKGINRYDIRKQCAGSLCYDFSNMERFLAQESVREALGVGDIEFVACSTIVYDNMISDWMRNLEVGIPALLEDGIKLLVYAGEYDFSCNWLGNKRWVDAMEWSGQKGFIAAPSVPFTTADGVEAGLQKSRGPLIFLKMHNAGHLVPMDQPNASLEMIHRWIQGKL